MHRWFLNSLDQNVLPGSKFKGNAQFIFLCNSHKLGASRVCITFPQITQKILTKDIIHFLEVITEILSFLQIFITRSNHWVFLIFQKTCKKINKNNYISDIFWAFKSKLQIVHPATYIHCFFLNLINVFFLCLVP